MKAAVIKRYGSPDVVKILEVPKPTPAADEVLIRVRAATVNRTDCGELRAHPFFMRFFYGLRRPNRTIFGCEFAGEVAAVGAGTRSFKPGDRVFGMCPSRSNGAQAEYVCVPERMVAAMTADARFDEAVVCEGAFYANTVLEKIDLKPGHTILIYGASGAIGTAMVQLAKCTGAAVTAVVATPHLELAKSLGADRTVHYTAEDFTRIGETFDFVVDAVGKTTFFQCRRLLKPDGAFAVTDLGPWGQNLMLAMWSSITRSNRVVMPAPRRINGFLGFLKGRLETGQFRAIVDRTYDLAAIADAYRYVETGQKVGIVVINVAMGELILSRHDWDSDSDKLAALPRLPLDDGAPVFAEPWQAQAFALAVRLSAQGHFTWKEWAATLAAELKADAARGEPDDGSRYYHCWLTALENLVVSKRLSDVATLSAQREAWAEAYRRTPHGEPIELKDDPA